MAEGEEESPENKSYLVLYTESTSQASRLMQRAINLYAQGELAGIGYIETSPIRLLSEHEIEALKGGKRSVAEFNVPSSLERGLGVVVPVELEDLEATLEKLNPKNLVPFAIFESESEVTEAAR